MKNLSLYLAASDFFFSLLNPKYWFHKKGLNINFSVTCHMTVVLYHIPSACVQIYSYVSIVRRETLSVYLFASVSFSTNSMNLLRSFGLPQAIFFLHILFDTTAWDVVHTGLDHIFLQWAFNVCSREQGNDVSSHQTFNLYSRSRES